MKENKLITLFKEAGLTDNESCVYFTSLSLGPSTVQKIARASEIKRTTVYDTIESLQHKGLMCIEFEGMKRRFVAESPEKLEGVLKQRQTNFKSHLPEMLSLFNLQGGEGFLKYYEGAESMKNVYQSMIDDIKPGEEYMVMSQGSDVFEIYGEWFEKFVERRAKLDINIRLIIQDGDSSEMYKSKKKVFNWQVKFLPKKTKLTTNLVITPQRVFINQLTPPITGIVIENKSMIHMHQQTFEILWSTLK